MREMEFCWSCLVFNESIICNFIIYIKLFTHLHLFKACNIGKETVLRSIQSIPTTCEQLLSMSSSHVDIEWFDISTSHVAQKLSRQLFQKCLNNRNFSSCPKHTQLVTWTITHDRPRRPWIKKTLMSWLKSLQQQRWISTHFEPLALERIVQCLV